MFEQPVRHILECHPHVFVADLLADDIERHGRKAGVHRPHDPRQNRAVADAGVEHPDRRRRGMDVGELERDRSATSVFSLQVETNRRYFCLLSKKRKPGGAVSGCGSRRAGAMRLDRLGGLWRGLRRGPAHGQKRADLLECFRGDPRPVAKAGDELSVVDDAPSESRFRGPRFAAEIPDLAEDLLVRGLTVCAALPGWCWRISKLMAQFRLSTPAQSQAADLCGVNHNPSGRTEWAGAHSCGTRVGASPLAYAMEGQSAAP